MSTLRRVLAVAGNPDCGRLGLGSVTGAIEFFTVVKSLTAVAPRSVAAGGAHTAVLANDGAVFTFGLNSHGQLGHSGDETEVCVPTEVPLPEPAVAIAAGNFHTLALTESGSVWAWGSNKHGKCGLGPDVPSVDTPRLVAALRGEAVSAVASGAEHTLAATKAGELYTWGCGESGRLGHGGPQALRRLWSRPRDELRPRLVRALETQKVVQVAAGHMHSGCVTDEGRCYVFGSGRFHQLGRREDTDAESPIPLQGPPFVADLACGGTHSLAVTTGGVVASWGADQAGALGRGKVPDGDIRRAEPVPGLRAETVAAGWKHSAAIGPGGRLMTWGWGGSQGTAFSVESGGGGGGQLGLGNDFDYWAPAPVTHLDTSGGGGGGVPQFGGGSDGDQLWRVLQVSCGSNHTAIIVELADEVPL